jgi:O-acetyl-ADP-ribose deacetylase (regulator of RNase III)
MTEFVDASGNLLAADVDALVNTVNTVGVMGKGIALQFKNAYPANFKAYARACKAEGVQLGDMFVFDTGALTGPRWIINFPTKGHWRSNSRLSDVEDGLDSLRATIEELRIKTIAIPPLGCGNGGLDWSEVRPLIEKKLDGLDVQVHIYGPAGAPAAADMVVATERKPLSPGKAALVALVARYSAMALGASLIEIQKLA